MTDKTEFDVTEQDLIKLVEDPDLRDLEEINNQFNIFEALRIVDTETRHSTFLCWLLSPQETHRMGDLFLRMFLERASKKAKSQGLSAPSVVELDAWDLGDTIVQPEYENVDILIHNKALGFACAIENKIWSGEHSNQLQRYWELVEQVFPGRNLYVFLTPGGSKPTDSHYVSMSYKEIRGMLHELMDKEKDISDDVSTLVRHYAMAIDRKVSESDRIKELSQLIYKKHRRVLELVMKQATTLQAALTKEVEDLVRADPDLEIELVTPGVVRFSSKSFDPFIPTKVDKQWNHSGRILGFEFKPNVKGQAVIESYVGPILTSEGSLRSEILGVIKKAGKTVFNKCGNVNEYAERKARWTLVHRYLFLDEEQLRGLDVASQNLQSQVRDRFEGFLKGDLQKMISAFSSTQ